MSCSDEIVKFKKASMNEFEMNDLGNMIYFLCMENFYSEKGIILHQLKYELEINPKLDYDVKVYEQTKVVTLQVAIKILRYIKGTLRYGVLFPFGVISDLELIYYSSSDGMKIDLAEEDIKIKVSNPVRLMIDKKSAISLAKNPMLHGTSNHIDTKFHFMHNQVQNGVLEVVHFNTQK
ncbi:uncharacterized protein LOC131618199 [Vicia villosa]|uniref:uncharacterized protein LOC131618199 n=1 Tax=Vicia villosa TaxID=3911 RepID=UPI00273B955F|nr:uncharacterized protein LOC131618199 [Vicia villosa]